MSQYVVGVRFKPVGRIYQFDPGPIELELHDSVIVETAKGREFGEIAYTNRLLPDEEIHAELKPILRRATPEDKRVYEELKRTEKEAREIFAECTKKRDMQMKLIDVEYTFDQKKIIFYFTAEGRVDFRDLVKDLASEFRVRIELRQIGVRDEAKNFNGIGICGRPCCCSEWIGEFFPVTIKMAKEQNLSLNSSKISGICGRLLCCLTYEQEYYEEISKKMPKVGHKFKTPLGPAEVFKLKTLEERILAKIKNDKDEVEIHSFTLDELELFKENEDSYPDEPVRREPVVEERVQPVVEEPADSVKRREKRGRKVPRHIQAESEQADAPSSRRERRERAPREKNQRGQAPARSVHEEAESREDTKSFRNKKKRPPRKRRRG